MSETQAPTRQPGSAAIPGPSAQRFTRRTVAIIVGAALATGLILVFGIPATHKFLEERWILELTAEASAHLENGEPESASKALSKAYQINPRDPETLRLIAKTVEQTPGGQPQASYCLRQLIEMHEATTEDTVAYGTLLLRSGSRDEAKKLLDSLPEAEKNSRPALELKASFLRVDGRTEEADKLLRAAYIADSGNPQSRVKLAILDFNSPFPEVKEQAAETLWRIAQSGGRESINAMRVLANQSKLTVPRAIEMHKLLEKLPGISDERRLSIVSGILRVLPLERENIIGAEAARQHGRPFEETATFIRWLATNNEHERLLTFLPASQAIRSAELFLPYVKAMESTRRWKELRELIRKNPSIPIPPADSALILARCAHSLQESSGNVRSHLADALKRAWIARDRTTMTSVGNAADEFGQPEIAIEAFSLLASQPQFKLPMLDRLLQIHQRQLNLAGMIDVASRCLKEQQSNPAYVESWCYLKLLEGSEMEKAADMIRRHVQDNPERRPTASLVQAFAAYRFGDLQSAGREAKSVVASKLPPGQRAVLAGILGACGREADAYQLAEKVPDSILLKEEARLLKPAL